MVKRIALVMLLAAALALLSSVASVSADPTATYTPIATRTPRVTSTPWFEATVAVDVDGTAVPVGTFSYSATAGDLIDAFLQIALILFLCVVTIWLYRNRA
jgi:hypothetical protein